MPYQQSQSFSRDKPVKTSLKGIEEFRPKKKRKKKTKYSPISTQDLKSRKRRKRTVSFNKVKLD